MASYSAFTNANHSNTSAFTSQHQQSTSYLQLYTVLAESIVIFNNLMTNFASGNFQYVASNLTMIKYNNLAVIMSRLTQDSQNFPDYEIIRTTLNNSLKGLLQSVNQYITLQNTQSELAVSKEKAAILTDMKLLQEYLNDLKNTTTALPSSNVTVVAAQIKHEYALYIKLYGYPTNGIFDIDKLAYCIYETTI